MLWSMGLYLSSHHRCKCLQARSSTNINCPSLHESFLLLGSPFEEVCDIQRCRRRPHSGQAGLVFRSENLKLSSTLFLLVTVSGGMD